MAGLYAGITFSNSGTVAPSSSASPWGSASATNAETAGQPSNAGTQPSGSTLDDAARYAAQMAEQAAKDAAEKEKRAALGFAPIVRRKPAAGKPKIPITGSGVAQTTAKTSTGPVIIAAPSLLSSTASSSTPASTSKAASTSQPAPTGAPVALTGRTLIVAPSMTLDDEDVNGFKATNAGKKAANKKKKNKGKNKKEEDPALAWTAEYDPARPTDYTEYKIWSKWARTQRREEEKRERERQRRIKEGYGDSGSGSDYTSDDSDDSDAERRRKIANAHNRFFAPPKSYDEEPVPLESGEGEQAIPEVSVPPATEDVSMTEDDTPYQPPATEQTEDSEWAAWSAAPVTNDDPYARRMALSQQNQTSNHTPMPTMQPPTTSWSAPSSEPTSAPPPFFMPPSSATLTSLPLPSGHTIPPPSQSNVPAATGSHSPSPHLPTNYQGESSIPPVPPSQFNTSTSTGVSIEEAQAKARAIAAKLASLKKPGFNPSPSPGSPAPTLQAPSETTTGLEEGIPGLGAHQTASPAPKADVKPQDFAKSLMEKYGWSKGQGLGATSQGMLNPLALSTDSKGGKGKQKDEGQSSSAQGNKKVMGMATAKGRVVSDLKTEKDKMEKEKYGEPSRIVCLTNMVGRHEVDDELVGDVSEEASKMGVLEKCFVHIMPPYVADDESVRVFVIFTGLVGAWKAVKAFDGRFFGGRTVKAKFYNEMALEHGALHL